MTSWLISLNDAFVAACSLTGYAGTGALASAAAFAHDLANVARSRRALRGQRDPPATSATHTEQGRA